MSSAVGACPICSKEVPIGILEWHVNEHLKDVASPPPAPSAPAPSARTASAPAPSAAPRSVTVPPVVPAGAPPPRTACPNCNRQLSPSQRAHHMSWCGVVVEVECPVCTDEVNVEETHTLNCTASHRLCNGCSLRMFQQAVKDNSLARCPMCREAIHSTDLREMKGLVPADLLRQYEEIEQAIVLGLFVRCPTAGCAFVVDVPEAMRKEAHGVDCPLCKKSMCTLCRMQPYHPGRTCLEAGTLKERWLKFVVSKCNDRMSAQFIKDQQERQKRHGELQQDEEFKRQHCRLCPHCKRAVQKLEGCDAMKCGVDYHGGNNQNGCGKLFNWAQASQYVPVLPTAPTLANVDAELLCAHEHGPYHSCVRGHEIKGPRFQCCNCPGESVECCHACLGEVLRTHPPDHYFCIHTSSE